MFSLPLCVTVNYLGTGTAELSYSDTLSALLQRLFFAEQLRIFFPLTGVWITHKQTHTYRRMPYGARQQIGDGRYYKEPFARCDSPRTLLHSVVFAAGVLTISSTYEEFWGCLDTPISIFKRHKEDLLGTY